MFERRLGHSPILIPESVGGSRPTWRHLEDGDWNDRTLTGPWRHMYAGSELMVRWKDWIGMDGWAKQT